MTWNRKETYAASMVIFIGFFYLYPLASSLIHGGLITHGSLLNMQTLKALALSLFYLAGGVMFFTSKNSGWVICVAAVLNYILVTGMYIIALLQAGGYYGLTTLAGAFFILLMAALVFLFGKETRLKFNVNNKSYLLVIGIYILLIIVTFAL